jgi:small GTP-binding protein
MGQVLSRLQWLWDSFQRETGVLILGLDNAGKTATLYALHLGEPMPYTVPTIGFNVEAIRVGNLDIKMWDIGGQDRFRALWPHYFGQTDGIAFVVDSADRDRFEIVRDELHRLMSHKDLVGKPFLILANKQDLPRSANKEELIRELQLKAVKSSEWHVVECSATINDRAKIGFQWLADQL